MSRDNFFFSGSLRNSLTENNLKLNKCPDVYSSRRVPFSEWPSSTILWSSFYQECLLNTSGIILTIFHMITDILTLVVLKLVSSVSRQSRPSLHRSSYAAASDMLRL
jgi:hypothetical protein